MKSYGALLLCVALLLSGCGQTGDSSLARRVGQSCVVQFRRDALGAAAPNGIPPQAGAYNGAEMNMAGRLQTVGTDWIVLADDKAEHVIPTQVILVLQFDKPTAKK